MTNSCGFQVHGTKFGSQCKKNSLVFQQRIISAVNVKLLLTEQLLLLKVR